MAFFDEVGKRFNDVVQSMQKTADSAKVQRQISQKMAEFDGIYRQIGQLYYASRVRNTPPDPTIDTLCQTVTALTEEIETLRKKADEIQNILRCPSCGQVIDLQSKFCSHCGAPITQPEAAGQTPEEASEKTAEDGEGICVDWPEPPAEETAEAIEKTAEETAEAVEEIAETIEETTEAVGETVEEAAECVEDAVEEADGETPNE